MKALCLVCLAVLISGCSGPSYCERRLVPINGVSDARSDAPVTRRLKHEATGDLARQGRRP